jgi:hypothetical protein
VAAVDLCLIDDVLSLSARCSTFGSIIVIGKMLHFWQTPRLVVLPARRSFLVMPPIRYFVVWLGSFRF